MLTPDQLEERKKGIGGSDAAAAVGLSPWKSPVQLWLEKTNRVEPENLDDNERVHFGNVLEDVVAQEYARRNHCKVQRRNEAYVHPEHEHMRANLDRLVVGRDRILEAKTVDKMAYRYGWDDDVPDHYRIQCHHMMIVTGKRESDLAALVGGNQFEQWEIPYHKDVASHLIAKEAEFWNFVVTDTPPPALSAADVVALYPIDNKKPIAATAELREFHVELLAVRAEIKSTEEVKEALEFKIKAFLGENADMLIDDDGDKLITWRAPKPTPFINHKAIVAELHDRILKGHIISDEEYLAIEARHSGERTNSRRFLVKPLKEKDEE